MIELLEQRSTSEAIERLVAKIPMVACVSEDYRLLYGIKMSIYDVGWRQATR